MTSIHFFINQNDTGHLLLKRIPCAECGFSMRPSKGESVLDKPVPHAIQTATCPRCGAEHFVASAATKADCVALEPVLAKMKIDPQRKLT